LGMFLRALKFGRVRQLDAVAARFLTGLTVHGGLIDTATLNYVDMDDTIRRTYGYAKQGSGTVPPASRASMRLSIAINPGQFDRNPGQSCR